VEYICLYFTYKWDATSSQLMVTIFGRFDGLAKVINCEIFQNDRSRGFVQWVPENGMFP
jgi:hypothetical protein